MNTTNTEVKKLKPTLELESQPDPRGLGALIALVEDNECPLPLQEVRVRANVVGNCCRTVIEQHFRNNLNKVLEAVHIFPLPENSALIEMHLEAGKVSVKAECREREEAEEIFQKAQQEGYRAGLLTQERADVHTLRVTNLPPQSDVIVKMVILEQLDTIDGRLRWRFPTTIAPRYLPGEPIGHEGPGVLPDSDHVPDASRLQPPLRLEGGTLLDLEVTIAGPVRELESSLHAIHINLGQEGQEGVRVAPSGKATLNRDFILAFSTAEEKQATAHGYTDGMYTMVFVEPPSLEIPETLPRDAVFIIDRSGSMSGPKMEAAKLALKSALHGLQEVDRFKLIAFSNDTQIFSEQWVEYSQSTLDKADAWIDQIQARGGTEMLPAVKQALASDQKQGRIATVLLITDGQVWNESELVAAVGHRRGEFLFFTMGIGTAVSTGVLKRMAKVGGGTCELLTPSDDIEASVARFEARFGTPIAEKVEVLGNSVADDRKRTLFTGRPESWIMEGAPKAVEVVGSSAEGDVKFEVEPVEIEFPLGSLWARARVAALEDRIALNPQEEEGLRPEILRIALEYGIASRFTAFVAVEKTLKVTGESVEIVQPVELPQDWDKSFLGRTGSEQVRGMTLGRSSAKYKLASMEMAMPQTAMAPKEHIRKRKHLEVYSKPTTPSRLPKSTVDGELARRQGADGSYGGEIDRTAAALIALVLMGHTRRKGIRRRTLIKAAKWLEGVGEEPLAKVALEILKRSEAGQKPEEFIVEYDSVIDDLIRAGEEGKKLKSVLKSK